MNKISSLIKHDLTPGILLIVATLLALILENSTFSNLYNSFLHTPVAIKFGALEIAKPLLL